MPRVTVCSEFFCDPLLWVTLERDILPGLVRSSVPLRALSVGCGPGLEPYGLATLLDDMAPPAGWQIAAFDLNPADVETAKAGGPFSKRDIRNVDPAERGRFFVETPDGFVVKPRLRAGVKFRVDDIRTADLPAGLDLILYRNVEPFFAPDENERILTRLFSALRPGGVVFLSSVDRAPGAARIGFERAGRAFLRHPVQVLAEGGA